MDDFFGYSVLALKKRTVYGVTASHVVLNALIELNTTCDTIVAKVKKNQAGASS